jgi:hypothetical protein
VLAPRALLPMRFPSRSRGKQSSEITSFLADKLSAFGTEHVSGYHMAVVAGIMFFTVRALFALMPDQEMCNCH